MMFERGQRMTWRDSIRQTVPCPSCSGGQSTVANCKEVC